MYNTPDSENPLDQDLSLAWVPLDNNNSNNVMLTAAIDLFFFFFFFCQYIFYKDGQIANRS